MEDDPLAASMRSSEERGSDQTPGRLRQATDKVSTLAGDAWEQTKERASVARERTEFFLRENPVPTVLGALAIFSIGLPLLIAGAMATAAAVRTVRGPFLGASSISAVAAAAVAVVVLVAGFEVTERIIVCPAHGSSGGGGTGLVTGPYYYDCVNGQLTFHAGSCNSAASDSNGNVTHPGC